MTPIWYMFFSDMECNRQNFLSFWIVFCRFISITTLKIKILKNLKNPSGDIILLHDHKLYCYLDMAHNGCNCFSFWAIFCPFTPPAAQKIKKIKNWKKKKHLEIPLLYICVPKSMIRWCTVLEIWCVTDVIIISHFGLFYALLPP